MGNARFLYNNLITDADMITVSSLRTGIVTAAKKNGTGSAVITASGSYSGAEDLEYIVEIDSIAGGAEVGQATFKWSDGGGSWDASGVATSAINVTLNNGVQVLWTTGAGADFVVGDKWYFKGINLFNASKMIDVDRDTKYRSSALESPNTITIDFGENQEITALIIFDHNFTSSATLLLEADDASSFDSDGGSAQFSEAVTWVSEKILHYLSTATTRRYWRLSVTDIGNLDGFIEIGEFFLGTYMEPSKNFCAEYEKSITLLHAANINPYGKKMKRFFNAQRVFEYPYLGMSPADVTLFEAMISAVSDRAAGTLDSFFFNDDSAETGNIWLVDIEELPETHMVRDYLSIAMRMTEVVKSV